MLKFNLDVLPESESITNTPSASARAFPFCLTSIGIFAAGAEYFTTRSELNSWLLLYTQKGCGEIRWRNQVCQLPKNTAVVIDCNEWHDYRTNSEEPWRFCWCHFEGDGIRPYAQVLLDKLAPIAIADSVAFRRAFEQMKVRTARADMAANAYINASMTELMTQMLCARLQESDEGVGLHRENMEKVMEYIEKNYERELSIEDMIEIAQLSKFHFIRVFKQQTGTTPYNYLIHCRINRSKQLLRDTDESVRDIAEAVGFSGQSNFIHQFKRIVGVTPAQYRMDALCTRIMHPSGQQ